MTQSLSERLNGWTKPQQVPSLSERVPANQGLVPTDRFGSGTQPNFRQLKASLQKKIIAALDPKLDFNDTERVRRIIEEIFLRLLQEEGTVLPRLERLRLFEAIAAEILSYGPIEPLLQDDTVTEIMVNGPDQGWIERDGILYETDARFEDEEHVMRIIDRIIAPLGRHCDESAPWSMPVSLTAPGPTRSSQRSH